MSADIYKKYGWGKRYTDALSRGRSHGYARWLADNYCERKARQDKAQAEDVK